MKRYLTGLVAIVLSITMGLAVGCRREEPPPPPTEEDPMQWPTEQPHDPLDPVEPAPEQ